MELGITPWGHLIVDGGCGTIGTNGQGTFYTYGTGLRYTPTNQETLA